MLFRYLIALLALGCLTAASPTAIQAEELTIRMTFEGGEATAVLEDNETTRSLLPQLPATVTCEDFAGKEKIASFAKKLSTQGAPDGYEPQIGEVACYGPWGNLVFFYGKQPYTSGLVRIGRVTSGLDKLAAMGTNFPLTVALIEQKSND